MTLLSPILSAVLIFLGIMVGGESWIIIFRSLSGFVMAPIMPTVFGWTNRLFDSRRGFVTGVIYGVGFAGGVFSPWLLGNAGRPSFIKVRDALPSVLDLSNRCLNTHG